MSPETAKAILNAGRCNRLIAPSSHTASELIAFVRRLERLRERRFVFMPCG